jgi:hypothetical protein
MKVSGFSPSGELLARGETNAPQEAHMNALKLWG